MYEVMLGYWAMTGSNYRVQNINNLFNLMIHILNISTAEQQREIITQIKLVVGMSFYDELKAYLIRKMGVDDPLIKLFS